MGGRPPPIGLMILPMRDAWIDVFARVAESYDTVVPFFSSFGRLMVAALPPPAVGARLLDVGAGTGAVALTARHRGYEVSAVDGSAAMVTRLSASLPGVQVADAAALPFGDTTFVADLADRPEMLLRRAAVLFTARA